MRIFIQTKGRKKSGLAEELILKKERINANYGMQPFQ